MAKHNFNAFKQKCVYCGKTLYWFSNKNLPLDDNQDGVICDECNYKVMNLRTKKVCREMAQEFHEMMQELKNLSISDCSEFNN